MKERAKTRCRFEPQEYQEHLWMPCAIESCLHKHSRTSVDGTRGLPLQLPINGRVAVFVRGPKTVAIVHVAEVLTPCLGGQVIWEGGHAPTDPSRS